MLAVTFGRREFVLLRVELGKNLLPCNSGVKLIRCHIFVVTNAGAEEDGLLTDVDCGRSWTSTLYNGRLESFTTSEIATGMDTGRELAHEDGLLFKTPKMIEMIGRRGRANLYRVAGR